MFYSLECRAEGTLLCCEIVRSGAGEGQGDKGCCEQGGLESQLLCLAQEASLASSTDRPGFKKCQGATDLHVICVQDSIPGMWNEMNE